MKQTGNQRGSSFEKKVKALLTDLRSMHPALVDFEHQYSLMLRTGRVVKPDFMLSVRHPDAIHVRLIECQSRDTSSHPVIDKIQAIRNNSDHNRFMFIHEATLSDAVSSELAHHGVTVYQFDDFAAFIAETGRTLTGIAAAHSAPVPFIATGPATVQMAVPARTFQPRVEKSFGNSPGITTKAGFGNSGRPGITKGR